ncbi:MAG: DUF1992 domain-containing protein [Caldilineaceae bacterium]|nr:DUF1992 domain-containing protein [Caldilineaceae bacterium]
MNDKNSRHDKKRLLEAKEKAASYQDEELTRRPDESARSGPKDLDHWTDLAGMRIEEAMRAGHFDDLPGAGKPINLARNPFVPDDQQMAQTLLKNNELTPGWIPARKTVLAEIDRIRTALKADVQAIRQARVATDDVVVLAQIEQTWARRQASWRESVQRVNRQIDAVNFQQPSVHLEIFKLIYDDELARAGAPS